jgi:hypothetical protein
MQRYSKVSGAGPQRPHETQRVARPNATSSLDTGEAIHGLVREGR